MHPRSCLAVLTLTTVATLAAACGSNASPVAPAAPPPPPPPAVSTTDRLTITLISLRVVGGDCDEISVAQDPPGGEFAFSIAMDAPDGRSVLLQSTPSYPSSQHSTTLRSPGPLQSLSGVGSLVLGRELGQQVRIIMAATEWDRVSNGFITETRMNDRRTSRAHAWTLAQSGWTGAGATHVLDLRSAETCGLSLEYRLAAEPQD
jgi:hypothetical protein